MAPGDDQAPQNLVITSLSVEVDEELLLLSQSAEQPAIDDDIEVVEYEVGLNSLHRAIHVVQDPEAQL